MPSWSAAAAAPAPAPARTRPRPGTVRQPRPRARTSSRPHVAGGIAWITALAVLLAGVVAVNVAVLRLNMQLDDLSRQRAKTSADNAALSSQLSSAHASAKIQQLARTRLGLVPASVGDTTYLDLRRQPPR